MLAPPVLLTFQTLCIKFTIFYAGVELSCFMFVICSWISVVVTSRPLVLI